MKDMLPFNRPTDFSMVIQWMILDFDVDANAWVYVGIGVVVEEAEILAPLIVAAMETVAIQVQLIHSFILRIWYKLLNFFSLIIARYVFVFVKLCSLDT